MQRIRVAHVIPDLSIGGAETALVRLLETLDRARFASLVVTLRDGGALLLRARAAADDVVSMGMHGRVPSPGTLLRLRATLRAFAPDVVQGWMYHANLAAWAGVRALSPRPALAWGIRQSLAKLGTQRMLTRLVIRAGAHLSRDVDAIVNNSRASVVQHAALGFAPRAVHVVANGFDVERFRPDAAARAALRAELGIPPDAPVAGLVARFDPVKRHDLFLEAAARVRRGGHDLHVVAAGPGVEASNPALASLAARSDLGTHLHLLGRRDAIEHVLPALDVLVSASGWAEGFPNVVGEAMACAVPCIVTDTGDSASVVGDTGVVVPPGDAAALAAAIERMLDLPRAQREALGQRARARVAAEFPLGACTARYAALYSALASAERAPAVAPARAARAPDDAGASTASRGSP